MSCQLTIVGLYGAVPVATSGAGGLIYEAKIEDGKLFYENRWFHKGQHIFLESKEHGQERYGEDCLLVKLAMTGDLFLPAV